MYVADFYIRRTDLVDVEDACPECGACSQHELVWKGDEVLHCQVCDTFYVPGSVRRQIAESSFEA